jgi:hypothetical protein
MLIIEKEGIVEQLAPYADEDGIALLNTRGFLTEYARAMLWHVTMILHRRMPLKSYDDEDNNYTQNW